MNLVDGARLGSVSGHVFRTEEGGTWPRSGVADVDAVLAAFDRFRREQCPSNAGAKSSPAALTQALVRAIERDDALGADLNGALGAVAESGHFTATSELVEAALADLARTPRDQDVPEGGDTALVLHWCESFAAAAARAIRAAGTARCIVIVTDPHIPRLGLALAAGLEDSGVDPRRIAVLHGDGLDGLRALAAEPEITVDAVRPDAFQTGLVASLASLRDAGRNERSECESPADATGPDTDGAEGPGTDWFGHGVVERPAAPLNVRMPAGLDLVVGEVDVPLAPGAVVLPATDLVEAAEEVVERAFGRGVLGGYAANTVARVFVERHAFSRFTGHLLEVLEDADGDPWFDPPAWAFTAGERVGPALVAARRIGLDEDGTLVYERRRRLRAGGGRRRGSGEPHGLVFTNIERRMRLGGSLRVPGVLALIRGGRGQTC